MYSLQDMFKTVMESLKVKLNENQRKYVEDMCHGFPPKKIAAFVEKLFECIMLYITIPEDEKCIISTAG